MFLHYIGGLQRYIPAAMVLVAPYVNSYRRLSRNTAAPINIEWGYDNRTVGLRAMQEDGDGGDGDVRHHQGHQQHLPPGGVGPQAVGQPVDRRGPHR
jgi:glutamine synthetase